MSRSDTCETNAFQCVRGSWRSGWQRKVSARGPTHRSAENRTVLVVNTRAPAGHCRHSFADSAAPECVASMSINEVSGHTQSPTALSRVAPDVTLHCMHRNPSRDAIAPALQAVQVPEHADADAAGHCDSSTSHTCVEAHLHPSALPSVSTFVKSGTYGHHCDSASGWWGVNITCTYQKA